jgi:signal transduction histidine kinase
MGRSLVQAEGKEIRVLAESADVRFVSDYNLVRRVLGNMVKNALEASRPGETVTLDSVRLEDGVAFRVHNPGEMPEEARLRVFRRNFSTKGQGRGLGTYGMKLLGERYLGGRVSFTSDAAAGTTFDLSLPLAPAGHARDHGGAAS